MGLYMSLQGLLVFVCVSHPRNTVPLLTPPTWGFQPRHHWSEKTYCLSRQARRPVNGLLGTLESPHLDVSLYCHYLALDAGVSGTETLNAPSTISCPV